MNKSLEAGTVNKKRFGLVGFVWWPRPQPAPDGSRREFLSVAESVQLALSQPSGPSEIPGQGWTFVRYASEGRRFIGWMRR